MNSVGMYIVVIVPFNITIINLFQHLFFFATGRGEFVEEYD